MKCLSNKHIVLGVTGGIAAYKSADLIRRLQEVGASVRVVMTEHAKEFITPLTLQALSGHPIHEDLFDPQMEVAMGHIALARWADMVLIAPASANCIARLAEGRGDDLLATICLATRATVAVVPAMNQGMWENKATQANLETLQSRGILQFGPDSGYQACGEVGLGRMIEPNVIVNCVAQTFETGVLAGQRVLITAGPTQEAIDPIRYISNRSSGKMGYALAQAAVEAGAKVTLVSGPVALATPDRVNRMDVISVHDMYRVVMESVDDVDIFISAAAVSDYTCTPAEQKIKRNSDSLTLTLERAPDILQSVSDLSKRPMCIGFAAETENLENYAKEKLKNKNVDLMIANEVNDQGKGIASDENEVIIIGAKSQVTLEKASKSQIAREIIDYIASYNNAKTTGAKVNAKKTKHPA